MVSAILVGLVGFPSQSPQKQQLSQLSQGGGQGLSATQLRQAAQGGQIPGAGQKVKTKPSAATLAHTSGAQQGGANAQSQVPGGPGTGPSAPKKSKTDQASALKPSWWQSQATSGPWWQSGSSGTWWQASGSQDPSAAVPRQAGDSDQRDPLSLQGWRDPYNKVAADEGPYKESASVGEVGQIGKIGDLARTGRERLKKDKSSGQLTRAGRRQTLRARLLSQREADRRRIEFADQTPDDPATDQLSRPVSSRQGNSRSPLSGGLRSQSRSSWTGADPIIGGMRRQGTAGSGH